MTSFAGSRLVWLTALLAAVGCGGGSGGAPLGGAGGEGGESGEAAGFTISDAEVKEGDVGSKDLEFTVTLSQPLAEVAKVAYSTQDDTATSVGASSDGGRDYEQASATLRFEPGETEQKFSITINGDRKVEEDETFRVKLSKPIGASIEHVYGIGRISNDDAAALPTALIMSADANEGSAGLHDVALTVRLSKASEAPVTIDYATADGSASAGVDYTQSSGSVTFPPGETQQVITIPVAGDTVPEDDETLSVTLSRPRGATLGAAATATLTLLNDDVAGPTLSINDASTSEGNLGTKTLSFTISLSTPSAGAVSVDYATVDGSASSTGGAAQGGMDFSATSDSVTFAPGETSKQVNITVYGDTLSEANETFGVELYNGVGAVVVDPQGSGTIANDDAQPTLGIGDVSIVEGAAGSRSASFLVSLSRASGQSVSVNFATSSTTAGAGSDYTSTTGTLTLSAGQTSAYITVTVAGDGLDESDETFSVGLSGATNAIISDASAVGTILDDDDPPQVFINDVALVEGDAGSKNAVFDVTLSAVSGRNVSVAWATNDVTAVSGQDYTGASGTLDFPAGTSSRSVTVAITGEQLDEANETFTVDLSAPINATLADDQGLGTIITDDSTLPALNIQDQSVSEGNAGTVLLTFSVSLSAASLQQVKVDYQTIGDMAVSGSDFQAATGSLTFAAGETLKTVSVSVNGDALNEYDETLYVSLTAPSNAYVADGVGLGTILNDDAQPTLSVDDVTLAEGNTGKKNATFTISLSGASGIPVSVTYATSDGSAVEAGSVGAGQDDYDAASDVALIPAGQTSVKVSVPINGDTVTEGNESFLLLLSSPQNATLADGSGQCTITNDEPLPSISIADVSLLEGDAGSKAFSFTLTLSASSGNAVTVDFATANGSALSGLDYDATSGTATFLPGQTTITVDVFVLGETAVEGHKDETFVLNLTNPQNATVSDAQATGTILDDD